MRLDKLRALFESIQFFGNVPENDTRNSSFISNLPQSGTMYSCRNIQVWKAHSRGPAVHESIEHLSCLWVLVRFNRTALFGLSYNVRTQEE